MPSDRQTRKLSTPAVEIQDINRRTGRVTIKQNKDFYTQVSRRLKPYKNLPITFKPALEEVADYARETLIPKTFKDEGPGWAPLAKRTVSERLSQGFKGAHPILKRTGDLFDELTKKSHPKHVEIIKTGKYARIEIGGSSAKWLENQMGKKEANLPARPMIPGTGFLPIAPEDKRQIARIISRAIKKRVKT